MLCGDVGACPMFERKSGLDVFHIANVGASVPPASAIRMRLSGRNDARERRLVSRIVPQSQSIIECIARYRLREAGFHVESQVNIPGMGHLDLMVDGRLGIETDGAGFHMDKPSFEEDRRRWNVTTRLGVPTLVVSYSMVKNRPREFVTMVRDTLRSLDRAA